MRKAFVLSFPKALHKVSAADLQKHLQQYYYPDITVTEIEVPPSIADVLKIKKVVQHTEKKLCQCDKCQYRRARQSVSWGRSTYSE